MLVAVHFQALAKPSAVHSSVLHLLSLPFLIRDGPEPFVCQVGVLGWPFVPECTQCLSDWGVWLLLQFWLLLPSVERQGVGLCLVCTLCSIIPAFARMALQDTAGLVHRLGL